MFSGFSINIDPVNFIKYNVLGYSDYNESAIKTTDFKEIDDKQFAEDAITMQLHSIESDVNRYTELDFSRKLRGRFNDRDLCQEVKKELEAYSCNKSSSNSFIQGCNEKIGQLESKWFDIKLRFHKEIWMGIFQNSGFKELGVMSSVSKTFEIMTKDDVIWKPKCLGEEPTITNPKGLAWKVIFKDEIGLSKFLGTNQLGFWMGQTTRLMVNFNGQHDDLTCKHLKQLVIKQNNLPYSSNDIDLVLVGKKLADEVLIKPLNLFKENTNGFLLRVKQPPK